MKKKLLNKVCAVILSLMLVIGLFPVTVLAANTATVQINGQILQDGVSVTYGDGTAVLDKANRTLTLDNVTITQDGQTPVVRVDNGELKVILNGENTITSTNMRAFYCNTVDLTIQGSQKDSLTIKTDSDGLQVDNGNLTIDGCKISITSSNYGGMLCFGNYSTGEFGILTIQNGANISIDSFENALMGEYDLFITDSTVNATARSNYQDWSTTAVSSYGNISITNSTVTATANGDAANAIYGGGTLSINNSEVMATTTSQINAYPALCSYGNLEINHSTATVKSAGTIGIWSSDGEVVIQDSIAYVAAHDKLDAIRGDNGGATISGSWVEAFGSMVSPLFEHSDSVIFLNNEGKANGSLILPGDVTVGKDMQLSVLEGAYITVPEGVTFTNHGQIKLLGKLVNNGGNIVCDSHTGSTATCTSKAVCDICGVEYGEIKVSNHTNLIKTEAKAATCTADGNTAYWTCENCGKFFSDENATEEITIEDTLIKATGHDYQDGKCIVCGAVDPNYEAPTEDTTAKTDTTDKKDTVSKDKSTKSPATGNEASTAVWIAFASASGLALIITYLGKKRKSTAK